MERRFSNGSRLYPTTEPVNTQGRVAQTTPRRSKKKRNDTTWIFCFSDGSKEEHVGSEISHFIESNRLPDRVLMYERGMRQPIAVGRYAVQREIGRRRGFSGYELEKFVENFSRYEEGKNK